MGHVPSYGEQTIVHVKSTYCRLSYLLTAAFLNAILHIFLNLNGGRCSDDRDLAVSSHAGYCLTIGTSLLLHHAKTVLSTE